MKIFISHKKEDEYTAFGIQQVLENMGIEAYLDILDDTISDNGEKLTKHIRKKLRECSDVIVVLSDNTKRSWWVPFEIGMATEKDMPIANYLTSYEKLPEYLGSRSASKGDRLHQTDFGAPVPYKPFPAD